MQSWERVPFMENHFNRRVPLLVVQLELARPLRQLRHVPFMVNRRTREFTILVVIVKSEVAQALQMLRHLPFMANHRTRRVSDCSRPIGSSTGTSNVRSRQHGTD